MWPDSWLELAGALAEAKRGFERWRRKGIDGLAGICRQQLERDPMNGWATVFRNRRATAVKILLYDGRGVTDGDVAFVRKLIAEQPALSRRALSQQVCQAWDWRQPNGVLKDAVCRSLLLALHRAGDGRFPGRLRRLALFPSPS